MPEQSVISDVLEDRYGSLWIAATSGLYRRWPDGKCARYTSRDGLPGDYLHDLLLDHEGRMWAGTRSPGFFQFSADATEKPPVVVCPPLAFRQSKFSRLLKPHLSLALLKNRAEWSE